MAKKFLFLFVFLSLILSACSKEPVQNNDGPIFFYGETCPHCQKVEEYMTENSIKDKYSFQELEVSKNKANAAIFGQKAKECKLDLNKLGVPMLYDNGACYMGDVDIIAFFENKFPQE